MESNPRVPYQLSTERRKLAPPDGKPLIVHVVVNVEHCQFDQPMPRPIMTPLQGRGHVPDVPNFSWSEYGNRRGMPRLLALLCDRGIAATASVNAGIIDGYRIGYVAHTFDLLRGRDDTVFMTGSAIADRLLAQEAKQPATPEGHRP